jgi:hypothetical protein
MARRGRRRGKGRLAGALVAAALLAGAGAAWVERGPLARAALEGIATRAGLGPARVGIAAVGFGSITAREVTLAGGALRAREIAASFDPLSLLRGHVRRVAIDGLDVALAAGADGLALGGRPLAAGADGGGIGIDALALSDAHVTLASGDSVLEARGAARLALGAGAVTASDIAAVIELRAPGMRQEAAVSLARLALAPLPSGGLRIDIAGGALTPEKLPLALDGLAADLTWAEGRLAAEIAAARLTTRGGAALPPVSLAGARADFDLTAEAGPGSAAKLALKGSYDRTQGSATAALDLAPLTFRPGALQPAQLVPALGGLAEDVSGSLAAAGKLAWRDGALGGDVVLDLRGIGFTAGAAQVKGLAGALTFTRLWPPATAPRQRLAATVTAAGLPPMEVKATGELLAKPALRLEDLSLALAGGTIAAAPFTLDPAAPRIDTALAVAGVDLGALMALIGVDGLSGSGTLDGRVPVQASASSVAIAGGHLAARGPGVIRYQPKKLPDQLAAAGQSVALAMQALADFHYDSLSLDLDKSAEGEGTVLLHLRGANPAVLQGQVFQFNIRVESDFNRLAELALLSLRSAQDLLRQAAREGGK